MIKCANCNEEFEEKLVLEDGRSISLRTRRFCPKCSPIGGGNNRTYIVDVPEGCAYCVRCEQAKDKSEFYTRKNGNPLSYCAECQKEVKLLKMQENLERIIEERGGACADCGCLYPPPVYEFYKEGKTYQLSKIRNMSLCKIRNELRHHEMLCKNCCAIRNWEAGS